MKNFITIILLFLFIACSHLQQQEQSKPLVKSEAYKRRLYSHWKDYDKNCLDTRAEVLKKRSLTKVTYKGKRGCSVDKGTWNDFYFNEVILDSKYIDIDHVVPLKNAHYSGANKWSKKEKGIFANDTENLVITNRSYNRQKGAKSPLEWLPIDKAYACKYMKKWIFIKNKYKLLIETEVLKNYINACDGS